MRLRARGGKTPMIYLDNAATSWPKAPGVAAAVAACMEELPGSVGRSSHALAVASSRRLFEIREKAASFFGLPASDRLVFTKNATEALNIVLLGSLPQHGRVLVSPLEHNAVMRPLRFLGRERGLRLDVFRLEPSGGVDLDSVAQGLALRPDLLVATAASNVDGEVLPVALLSALAHEAGVPTLVDASQLVGHGRVDFMELGADYVAFSGHKGLLGPAGTGGLYLAPGRHPLPLIHGGTGSASESELQPEFLPDRYEAGTHNLAALAGLEAALLFLESEGLAAIASREEALLERLEEGISRLPVLRILGPGPHAARAPILSCVSDSLSLGDIARGLDEAGVAVRMGLQCAPAAHRHLGSYTGGGSLRLSPGAFTTFADIDGCLAVLEEVLS